MFLQYHQAVFTFVCLILECWWTTCERTKPKLLQRYYHFVISVIWSLFINNLTFWDAGSKSAEGTRTWNHVCGWVQRAASTGDHRILSPNACDTTELCGYFGGVFIVAVLVWFDFYVFVWVWFLPQTGTAVPIGIPSAAPGTRCRDSDFHSAKWFLQHSERAASLIILIVLIWEY